MKLTRLAFVLLLIGLMGVAFAAGVCADVFRVTSLSPTVDPHGWQTHSLRCWSGKGGILSYYNAGARGNAGPAPGANLGFELPENGSVGGTDQPGQSWTGTDRYVGTKLADIKKINYWAILDWAGINTFPLTDENGCNIYHEWRIQSQASQPPCVVLTVQTYWGSTDWRKLVYRPWSGLGGQPTGFGPSAVEFNATGAARLHRIWQEYTAVDTENGVYDGCWYVTESADIDHPTGMYTWDEVLAKYPEAVLATPNVVQNPAFYSDPAEAPIPCSFNLQMGAMANSNPDWASVGKNSWWYQSYWARGAADLVTFKYDADPTEVENIVEETFDFDRYDPAYPVKEYALNNLAVYDQGVYMPGLNPPDELPNRRTRKSVRVDEPIAWGEGTVVLANFNAPQRYGYFGTSFLREGGVAVTGSTTVNQFTLYGKVTDDPAPVVGVDNGYWFYLDDGAGKKVKCFCPGAIYDGKVAVGNYLRIVGSLQGNNPYEWYWNNFHYVNPSQTVMSKPWPWEFQTYTWDVTVLNTP